MIEKPTEWVPPAHIIRQKTFQEATKGNNRVINDIQEQLQDLVPVPDHVRENFVVKMNSIMDDARTKLTDTAFRFWTNTAPPSEPFSDNDNEHFAADTPVDTAVDYTLTQNDECTKRRCATMWLDIVTDERKQTMGKNRLPADGIGLEYVSARSLSIRSERGFGEGQYSALGGAYIRFIPRTYLTAHQRMELDLLTDSWDAFLAVYNSLTFKYKHLLQKHDQVTIPGGPVIIGKARTDDGIWNDFMDTNRVRKPILEYVTRNLGMFDKYYDKMAEKKVTYSTSPASDVLADLLIRAVLKSSTEESHIPTVAKVIKSVPKRIRWVQQRQGEDVEFQFIVPTFYVDPDTRAFRIRMNVLDASFSMEAVRKSGICWSHLHGMFDYIVRLRKYTVNGGALKFVFGEISGWLEEGKKFLQETTQDGTNAQVRTGNVPW